MKKNNHRFLMISIIILIIVAIFSVIIYNYLQSEKEQYELYNDYNRASIGMIYTFTKDLDSQYSEIRHQQRYVSNLPISKGELVYNFSKYKIIPILNYLNTPTENETVLKYFSEILEFTGIYSIIQFELSEDIFIKQNNGLYYYEEDGYYIYTIKKKVITKSEFNNLYFDYTGTKDLNNRFAELLLKNENIRKEYSKTSLLKEITENYNAFYSKNEKIVLEIISEELKDFSNYLYSFVEEPKSSQILDPYSNDDNDNQYKINLDLVGEEIILKYKFSKVQRIYNEATKYSDWLYKLELEDLWQQLESLNYPILYQ